MYVCKLTKSIQALLACSITTFLLCSCASSDVSRDVSSNIDVGVQHTRSMMASNGDTADSWQNASQTVKGGILGGTTGAIAGGLASSFIGILPGALIGTVAGSSYGSYIETNETLADRLRNRGVTLVTLGDNVLIVLPSARVFNAMTANIKPSSYGTLNLVTRYINGYTSMMVKVSAYTNDIGSSCVNQALSQSQAENVADYLTMAGVNTRIVYAVGYGGQNLVQRRNCVWGDSDNYRVEITLEKEYV